MKQYFIRILCIFFIITLQFYVSSLIYIAFHSIEKGDNQVLSVCLKGAKSGPVEGPQEGDCSLAKAEATVKTTRRAEASGGKNG